MRGFSNQGNSENFSFQYKNLPGFTKPGPKWSGRYFRWFLRQNTSASGLNKERFNNKKRLMRWYRIFILTIKTTSNFNFMNLSKNKKKFIYSEKAANVWKESVTQSVQKTFERIFFKFLWHSQNMWTLGEIVYKWKLLSRWNSIVLHSPKTVWRCENYYATQYCEVFQFRQPNFSRRRSNLKRNFEVVFLQNHVAVVVVVVHN